MKARTTLTQSILSTNYTIQFQIGCILCVSVRMTWDCPTSTCTIHFRFQHYLLQWGITRMYNTKTLCRHQNCQKRPRVKVTEIVPNYFQLKRKSIDQWTKSLIIVNVLLYKLQLATCKISCFKDSSWNLSIHLEVY